MQSSSSDATSQIAAPAQLAGSVVPALPSSPLAPQQSPQPERRARTRQMSATEAASRRSARSLEDYTYTRSRSEVASSSSSSAMASSSRSREPSQPALSFMAGSWKGGLPNSLGYGNHSLIQMIKAISLDAADTDDNDEVLGYPPSTTSPRAPSSPSSAFRSSRNMSYSIDAIHSPLSRRKGKGRALPSLAELTAEYDEVENPTDGLNVGPELEAGGATAKPESRTQEAQPAEGTISPRSRRKSTLAEKLQEVFEFDEVEEVLAEYSCWLFRSVMLQGFLYLTSGHLSFYAYLQRKEGQTIRSGSLSKKSSRSPIYSKFWFILRDGAFSWYTSSADPYFPVNQIDLHYVTGIEMSRKNGKRFRVITALRQFHFEAESEKSRQEWIRVIKKAVVRAQNEGESVKIAIPLGRIAALNVTEDLEFAKKTLRVAVQDQEGSGETAADEYYWSFDEDPQQVADAIHAAILQIRDRLQARTSSEVSRPTPRRVDTTEKVRNLDKQSNAGSVEKKQTSTAASALALAQAQARRLSSVSYGLAARINLFGRDTPYDAKEGSASLQTGTITPVKRGSSSATITKVSPHQYPLEESQIVDPSQSLIMPGYRYPPGHDPAIYDPDNQIRSAWSLPQWLRQPPSMLGIGSARQILPFSGRKVSETVSKASKQDTQDDAFEIVSAADLQQEYCEHFGTNEEVVFRHHGYLFRGLPIYGYVYLTTKHFTFRSTSIVSKSKMILPLAHIIAVQKARAYRFGYSGLVVVVRGHEELFFELPSRERRNDILRQLDQQLDSAKAELAISRHQTKEEVQANMLKELESPFKPFAQTEQQVEEESPIMFNSASSSFVTFRPSTSLHITCLTVGSRGDVQPYIALCLGLMRDGHKCRIASHPEYKDWIEGYGIEFSAVGGDPAELMRICVENGMFTVSFLREGVAKFRGWLDDLLETSWTACQGTDLLIESPSTMAGSHIAEALQIPFFKAFTMPWTRTRAYPHAFAVPETKMGGSYNYMTYTIFDQVFWRAIAGQINRWREKQLRLQPTNQEKMESHRQPFLYNFSPSVVPAPLDWMEYIHVTGYWFLPNADAAASDWQPPAPLLDFMARAKTSRKKLVYIGFGSIVVSEPEALTKLVVEALQRADVWAIISKGWSDRAVGAGGPEDSQENLSLNAEAGQSLPDTIFSINSVPHDWLFPQVDAVCHHGGAGTTGASLRCGKPTIVRPFFGDQAFWAERVESLGVGRGLRQMTSESLAQALVYATTDKTVHARAEALGKQIRKEDGVATAIEAIYRDFEYAKSLIRRDTSLDKACPAVDQAKDGVPSSQLRDEDTFDWDMLSEREEGSDDLAGESSGESVAGEDGGNKMENSQNPSEESDTPPPFLTKQSRKGENQ